MTARRTSLAPYDRAPWAAATPADLAGLYASARRLREAGRSLRQTRPLAGRNLALMRPTADAAPEHGLHRAAVDLGARVAQLKLAKPQATPQEEWQALARVLGRMYDAIDCVSDDPNLPDRMAQASGVPVFDDLDHDDHPVRALSDLLTWHESQDARARTGLAPILLPDQALDPRTGLMVRAARALGHPVVQAEGERVAASSGLANALLEEAVLPPWQRDAASFDEPHVVRAANHHCLLQAVLLRTLVGD